MQQQKEQHQQPKFVIPKKPTAAAAPSSSAFAAAAENKNNNNKLSAAGVGQKRQNQNNKHFGQAQQSKPTSAASASVSHDFKELMAQATQNDALAMERLIEQMDEFSSARERQQHKAAVAARKAAALEAEVGVSAGRELTCAAAARERLARQKKEEQKEKQKRLNATGYRVLPSQGSDPTPKPQQKTPSKSSMNVSGAGGGNGQTAASKIAYKRPQQQQQQEQRQRGVAHQQKLSRHTNGTMSSVTSQQRQQQQQKIQQTSGKKTLQSNCARLHVAPTGHFHHFLLARTCPSAPHSVLATVGRHDGHRADVVLGRLDPTFLSAHVTGAVQFNLALATHATDYEKFAHYRAEVFEQYAQLLGLNSDDHLVFYGRGPFGGMLFASRAYWLFKSYGHAGGLSVLDGGLTAWEAQQMPVVSTVNAHEAVFVAKKGNWRAKTEPSAKTVSFEQLTAATAADDGTCTTSVDNCAKCCCWMHGLGPNLRGFRMLLTRPNKCRLETEPSAKTVSFEQLTAATAADDGTCTTSVDNCAKCCCWMHGLGPNLRNAFDPSKQMRAGSHLPGAFNVPSTELIDAESGQFVSLCNSGIQASMLATLLNAHFGPQIGHKLRVYIGSMLEEIDKCADPAAELRTCIHHSIEEAILDGQNTLGATNKVGVIISSELLDQGDIILPITTITSNIVDAVFNQFCKVEQSKSKHVNLYGSPFIITVTVLNTNGLPRQRTTKGKGRPPVSSQSHIFKVNNNDNYCLFYALELMRYYSLYKRGSITEKRWRWLNNNQTTVLRQKALQLLREAGIPTTQTEYDAEVYIHQVQGLWNVKHPGEYKIFIFNDYQMRPITKSDVTDYQFPILLYHHNNHFDGIKTLSKYFKKRYYCISCESPYSHKLEHSMNCTSLCHGCREVGVDYPCEPQQGYVKKCEHCNNTFYNNNCYGRHLHKDLCTKFQRCGDCGVVYNIKVHGSVGHKCGEQFCKLCKQFHIKEEDDDGMSPCRKCFIQPLKLQKTKPYRIIAYDFEATQDKKVGNRFEHEVNFAAATIICTDCINNGEWKNSLQGKKCQICGPHRTITFSPFDYTETTVDQKVITQQPLREFVQWLLFDHNKKFPTVAFAHFGGRYNMTMIIKEF
ncbi:hypothetical protein niasHT_036584 [Heterodera trifolii]|uniref:Rhodanese domain-containing protein n=1 Tax=Heterodera trifolii TaxID=157864 RepID=A0ABD2I616_9BILA